MKYYITLHNIAIGKHIHVHVYINNYSDITVCQHYDYITLQNKGLVLKT